MNTNIVNAIIQKQSATTIGIQIGANTQSHDQEIIFVNFSVMKIKANAPENPRLVDVFLLLIFFIFYNIQNYFHLSKFLNLFFRIILSVSS